MSSDIRFRLALFLALGELHNPKTLEPARPRWFTIPDRGFYAGIAVFAAIVAGKISCSCIPSPSGTST